MKTEATAHTIQCDAERTFMIAFYPAVDGEPPFTLVDLGTTMRKMPTAEFVRQMSVVMLEAFEYIGGPFGISGARR